MDMMLFQWNISTIGKTLKSELFSSSYFNSSKHRSLYSNQVRSTILPSFSRPLSSFVPITSAQYLYLSQWKYCVRSCRKQKLVSEFKIFINFFVPQIPEQLEKNFFLSFVLSVCQRRLNKLSKFRNYQADVDDSFKVIVEVCLVQF